MSSSSESSGETKKRKRRTKDGGKKGHKQPAVQTKLFQDKEEHDRPAPKRRRPAITADKLPLSRESLEWVKAGYEQDITRDEKTGVVTSLFATCRLCQTGGVIKSFKVLNPRARSQCDPTMYKSSASWSGPARHLVKEHRVQNAEELAKALVVGPRGGMQMRFKAAGSMAMHLTTWTPGGDEWKRAVRAVSQYAAVSNSPFHIGETAPFVNFMRQFLPSWPFIGRDAVVRSVSQQSAAVRRDLKELFKRVQQETRLAMTSDMWSSRANDGYLTMTVHWIDDEWRLRKKILGG